MLPCGISAMARRQTGRIDGASAQILIAAPGSALFLGERGFAVAGLAGFSVACRPTRSLKGPKATK